MNKWQWMNDILTQRKISQAEFAEKVDWNQARVSELLSNKRDIPSSKLYNIAKFFNLDLGELTAYNLGKADKISLSLPTSGTTAAAEKIVNTVSSFFKKAPADNIAIDILDVTACCGNGIDNFSENVSGQWIISTEDFRTISHTSTPDKIKMLRICGDSMEPTLKDGDWVLTDTSRRAPESDGIYLLHLSTGLAVKRLQGSAEPNTIRILSDNQHYKDENAKLSDIIILGRIIYTQIGRAHV